MGNMQSLIMELAKKIGIDAPVFDENVACIQFDDMILNFYADEDAGEICLFMNMGSVPKGSAERLALYAHLLKLNNFGREIGGGILGVDADEEQIAFSRFFQANQMELPQFETVVEAFLNLAESLRNKISGPDKPNGDARSESVLPPMQGGIRA